MSVNKINLNLPINDKFSELNNMILEVNGKNEQGQFDKNELDQIYSDLGLDRKFRRNVLLEATESGYVDWTHFHAESGYSIWYREIGDYAYNANNQLFLDDKLLEFRGQALSSSATTFDYVYLYVPEDTYYNYTTEAGTEGGTEFDFLTDTDQWFYVGLSTQFSGIKFEFETRGSNYTPEIYYYNGGWTLLSEEVNDLDDNTNSFASDGVISWTAPSDETTVNIYSHTAYWIRIKTSTVPVTTAAIYYCIPANNVIGLLGLSSSQVLNEEWCWCSLGQTIYVTLRNTGVTAYEGDYYITSSSSSTNQENFFLYNHEFKMNYEDSTYVASSLSPSSGLIISTTSETSPVLTLTTEASYSGTSDDPIQYTYQIVGQTTGATASAISNWTLELNTVYIFHAIVVARRTGGSGGTAGDGAGYVVTAVYKRTSSGAATLIGSIDPDVTCENVSGWDCTYTANGNDVQLLVTGAANTNITWHATVTVQKVSD